MEPVEVEVSQVVEVPPVVEVPQKKCMSCYMQFPATENHFACCNPNYGGNKCTSVMCGTCIPLYIKGRNRDNKGWIRPQCSRCRADIDYNLVRTLLGDEFDAFDTAMVRMTLASIHEKVISCPGVNCGMVYFKPPTRKEKKRLDTGNAACQSYKCVCGVSFCTLCGEKWVPEHENTKCVQYAKWKKANDPETLSIAAWLEANPASATNIKQCPGCKHMTEKNGGCNNHNCVLCGFNFCWLCLGKYGACKCAKIAEKRRAEKLKKKQRKQRKKAAAVLAAQLEIIARGNLVSTVVAVESVTESVISTRVSVETVVEEVTVVRPQSMVVLKAVDGTVNDIQDWDVIVLRPSSTPTQVTTTTTTKKKKEKATKPQDQQPGKGNKGWQVVPPRRTMKAL